MTGTSTARLGGIAILALTCVVPLLSAQAPLPAAVKTAHTIYLQNGPGSDVRGLDELAKQLRKMKRFELVDAPEKADMVVTLSRPQPGQVGAVVPVAGLYMTVAGDAPWALVLTDRDGQQLYADTQPIGMLVYGSIKGLTKRLAKRLEATTGEPPSQP